MYSSTVRYGTKWSEKVDEASRREADEIAYNPCVYSWDTEWDGTKLSEKADEASDREADEI